MASRKLKTILTYITSTSSIDSIQQIPKTITSRFYSTSKKGVVTLYSKISSSINPNVNITPQIDKWVASGNKLRRAELRSIIRDLRIHKRFTHALQVSEWMNKKDEYTFSSAEHAVQIDLIGRVQGFPSAEAYFDNLADQEKDEKTHGALFYCYIRQQHTEKAESLLEKMKEMGFASSTSAYNGMMSLYAIIGEHEKAMNVLNEMKENKISPDNFSYKICMKSYGEKGDIEGVDKLLTEMESQPHLVMDWNIYAVVADLYIKAGHTEKGVEALKKAEEKLEAKDAAGYNHLITLYANLMNKDEVLRLWGLEIDAFKRRINRDYMTMLETLVKLNEFEEAEKVLKEWESSDNCYDFRIPKCVIVGYCERGLFGKAEKMLEELTMKGKSVTPDSWEFVATGYTAQMEMKKAVKCMREACSRYVKDKGWKPDQTVISAILSWLGDEGSVEDVEAIVKTLITIIPINREMYHALIKANIKSGKRVDKILAWMKIDKINQDEDTKKILSSIKKQI